MRRGVGRCYLPVFSECGGTAAPPRKAVCPISIGTGTGSGVWGIELAKRGLAGYGHRYRRQGAAASTPRGNEGRCRDAARARRCDGAAGGRYRLRLPVGPRHRDLPRSEKDSARGDGAGGPAVAAADATVLLLVWPKRRRPLIAGASRGEVEAAFPGWQVTHVEPSYFRLPKILDLLMKPDEHWYRLRRR